MTKHAVIRTCSACKRKGEKSEFIRVVRTTDDRKVQIDRKQKISGRGVYFCPNPACLKKALRMRSIEKAYRWLADVPQDIYERLMEECQETGQTG